MTTSRLFYGGVLAVAALLVPAARASAQTPATGTGPLVLQPVSSSVVFAPDVKVTAIHGQTGILAGGYVGKLLEQRVLIGGGAYWLADPRDDARMFYAGLVVGGTLLASDQFNLSVRALAGFGDATLYESVSYAPRPPHGYHWRPGDGMVQPPPSGLYRVGFSDQFALFEPETRLAVRVTDLVSVNVGLGYRITSADGWMNEELRGVVGSVGVAFAVGH